MSKTGRHLTPTERGAIEAFLREGYSIRHIANRLQKNPSSISREINNHTKHISPKVCDCVNFKNCVHKKVCNSDTACRKDCRNCSKAKKYCPDYVQSYCEKKMDYQTGVCNQCKSRNNCHFEHDIYVSKDAQKEADKALHDTRSGRNIEPQTLDHISEVVTPLLKCGQSVYHIIQNHGSELGISESTLRRMINDCDIEARNLDLRTAVKMKPRRKRRTTGYKTMKVIKEGHKYEDFLEYMAAHDDAVVEMDCVEGTITDNATLLTLHFKAVHFQIAIIMDYHTSDCVVKALDKVEMALGKELFAKCFPVILTDNGHEFADIEGMERSVFGGKRTVVFFCEPNRSDQKGSAENNHKYIRYVIPKGTSLEPFNQMDITKMMCHVNSFNRRSLGGTTPFKFAALTLPEDFFTLLGLEEIPADDVCLKPRLLKK